MSEEEKQAIEYLENQDNSLNWNYGTLQAILQVLNYIDKLQKELKDSINARFELQRRIDKTQKENAELKEEIKDLIEENHKHIDYIANMKKKHEDKIRTKIKELEEQQAIEIEETGMSLLSVPIRILEELLGE